MVTRHLISTLDTIRESFNLSDDCEITLEANPESFSSEDARLLAAAGFTRVSIGVQSFDEDLLDILGRAHDADSAWTALRSAKEAGLRVSADLMLGLPISLKQAMTKERWDILLTLVDHVSVYPLTVEEGTELEKREVAGKFQQSSEEIVADEVVYLEALLDSRGFTRYEISSYARPGQESRQNQRYWLGGDYLGFGLSASSMLNQSDGSRKRFVMYDDMEDFLDDPEAKRWVQFDPAEYEALTPGEARREDIMLALRTKRGASAQAIAAAGLIPVCDELVEKGLLEVTVLEATTEAGSCEYYRCTGQGWLLANIVFAAVWLSSN